MRATLQHELKQVGRKIERSIKHFFQNIFFSVKPPVACVKTQDYSKANPGTEYRILNPEHYNN